MAGSSEKINPDLLKERNNATIDTEELSCLIHGGPERLLKKRKLEEFVLNDPDYKVAPTAFLSREEQFDQASRTSALAIIKRDNLGDLVQNHRDLSMYTDVISTLGYPVVGGLHEAMFVPTIEKQATKEQQEKWLPLSRNYQIVGTYAQTEMGHGTFLRGLETTAHYDPNTQEFVLNSPTVSSIKWWPGSMGKTSTHAIVLAQLYSLGECHGIHPFIVQLRSLEDHKPLPGITVGDIGPKFGFSPNDNGYLKLDNHRIPRENMLMKYSQVAPNGTYSKPPREKLTYGTMTFIRAGIVGRSSNALAQGVTIAVRYSAVRRQSEMRPGEPEPQIISYPTQQHKLFPLVATAYAFHFVKTTMMSVYHEVNALVSKGDFSRSQELHALSSGLKAFTTWVANAGLEVLRMSCGGHGYSQASGFPALYAGFTPACTYEGENTVLMLQTARYLIKCAREAATGKTLPGTVAYLSSPPRNRRRNSDRNLSDLDFLESLYRQRAYNLVYYASSRVDAGMKDGLDLVGAINKAAISLVQAANAHSHYFVVENMTKKMQSLEISHELRRVMKQLGLLYALDGIDKSSGEFLEEGILSGEEVKAVRQLVVDLLPQIRINAVALVDAFAFRDEVLNSVLGRYDGNVYENLYKWAQQSPLNKADVHPTYHKYLRPLLKRNLAKESKL